MLKSFTPLALVLILGLLAPPALYSQTQPPFPQQLNGEIVKSQILTSPFRELKFNQNQWQNYLSELKSMKTSSPAHLPTGDFKVLKVQGPGTSGGGNNYESEFYYLGAQVIKEILSTDFQVAVLKAIESSFLRLKSENALFFTDDKLILNDKEKIAINDYAAFVVIVNTALWDKSTFSQKRQIIVHELLGLAKSIDPTIDDSDYSITNHIFQRLQKKGQKVFLLNSDFPQVFQPAAIKTRRLEGTNLTYQVQDHKDKCIADSSKIVLDMKRIETTKAPQIQVIFSITCEMAHGGIYGHSDGQDGDNILEVTSQNMLEMDVDYGSFLVGWISGEDMLIRTPFQLLKIKKNSDGTYSLRFEFFKIKDQQYHEFFDATVSAKDLP